MSVEDEPWRKADKISHERLNREIELLQKSIEMISLELVEYLEKNDVGSYFFRLKQQKELNERWKILCTDSAYHDEEYRKKMWNFFTEDY